MATTLDGWRRRLAANMRRKAHALAAGRLSWEARTDAIVALAAVRADLAYIRGRIDDAADRDLWQLARVDDSALARKLGYLDEPD